MRVIAKSALREFWQKHSDAEQPLRAWHKETLRAQWRSANEIKRAYRSASIINHRRVVFNIGGNKYRLVVDVNYSIQIVFIVWLGSHSEYDRIHVADL